MLSGDSFHIGRKCNGHGHELLNIIIGAIADGRPVSSVFRCTGEPRA